MLCGYLAIFMSAGVSSALVLHLWDKPAEDVFSYFFDWVFPWQSLSWVGMSCICCACSFDGRVVWGLWSPGFCGQPLVGFGRVVPIWCRLVFSLSVDVKGYLGCSLRYTSTILNNLSKILMHSFNRTTVLFSHSLTLIFCLAILSRYFWELCHSFFFG